MYRINKNIERAFTLPASFYGSAEAFESSKEKLFAGSWQYACEASAIAQPGRCHPFTLLPGFLDEPLLMTRCSKGEVHCLSNVCTHRGNILVEESGSARSLNCGYHGRCFDLDGSFRSMPAFEAAEDFPSPEDDLSKIPFTKWLGMIFASLNPVADFDQMVAPIRERVGWMPLDRLRFRPDLSRTFRLKAHWALYCDNYLEGLHVPFVHRALHDALDFGEYGYELFDFVNLQLGIAREEEPCFDLPDNSPDYGRRIYAYYFWLFPNLMFNFYPWGLSLNVVRPKNLTETEVEFRTYLYPDTPFDREANQIELTELEDEAVVERVQKGIRSRYYQRGRFSPGMEKCVHHFHRLIAQHLDHS